jgi:hypothetical protein
MRTTIPFAESQAFDPETAHLMAASFDNAWNSLADRGDRLSTPLKAAHSREVLAKRIIELARRGERDSTRLCDDALAYLREQSADGRQRTIGRWTARKLGALITGGDRP